MSILIDYSNMAIASIMVAIGFNPKNQAQVQLDEKLIRKMILQSLRSRSMKFRGEFGRDIILACDDSSAKNWRKEHFPYYKCKRKLEREESGLNWPMIYEVLEKVKAEIKANFPYPVVEMAHAEADDVIGVITSKYGKELGGDPILIVSRDKDFVQLQKFSNVKQYNPFTDKFMVSTDPERDLKLLIINGDSGDSVPNIFSVDESFALGIRQKPAFEKKVNALLPIDPQFYDEPLKKNFRRNEMMIDLSNIPQTIQRNILEEYAAQQGKSRSKLMLYLANNCPDLLDSLGDF